MAINSTNSLFKQYFHFNPTRDQINTLESLRLFISSTFSENPIFLLTGYAGTGKTSLIGALIRLLNDIGQKTVLLAPTGRSAKVFSLYAGKTAFTIHKKIYRQKSYSNDTGNFVTTDNLHKETLFIVDEASMISNNRLEYSAFGSGNLLNDLVEFVYSGERCRMILIGDHAQLPPISETKSPALNISVLESMGLTVYHSNLTEIVRQDSESGILFNATYIRNCLKEGNTFEFPKFKFKPFNDCKNITGEFLIEEIASAYSRDGIEETMVITRSNKRAVVYNNGIRNRILYQEEELSNGDRIMVAKNNYTWKTKEKNRNNDFIANGEILNVVKVKKHSDLYGFHFSDVIVRSQDDDSEMELKLIKETLQSEAPSLNKEQNDKLFYAVLEDYNDIAGKANKIKKMKADPFYNALQVKFAYAITCHKAQGGQWKNVFIDIGYLTEEFINEDLYRWLYTAITRATERLYFVNLPDSFIDNSSL